MTGEKAAKPIPGCMVSHENGDKEYITIDDMQTEKEKPSLLLHSCCGPCSTAVIEQLICDYDITVFFYNPNITDRGEYEKRRNAQMKFIEKYNEDPDAKGRIGFKEGDYDSQNFIETCSGMESEPEGGRRCRECFIMRLEKTAETARLFGYDAFATTLTVSPHKNCEIINKIGKMLAIIYNLSFLDRDFKKKAGYQRSIELSKKYDLYRQNYCGCEYSKIVKKIEI